MFSAEKVVRSPFLLIAAASLKIHSCDPEGSSGVETLDLWYSIYSRVKGIYSKNLRSWWKSLITLKLDCSCCLVLRELRRPNLQLNFSSGLILVNVVLMYLIPSLSYRFLEHFHEWRLGFLIQGCWPLIASVMWDAQWRGHILLSLTESWTTSDIMAQYKKISAKYTRSLCLVMVLFLKCIIGSL